ncbi:MAG: porin [Pseudomonadota bacterium]
MNKKLIAAAVAAAVALPMAAQGGVQIYGKIHASIDYIDPQAEDDFWDVTSHSTRIGFKGSEDLGNGLKAIWKAEVTYDLTNGDWGRGRNSYIGLAGDWGTVLMGRHDTPLKMSTAKLDLFADRLADYDTAIGFEDARASDVVAYISPNFNGLTVAGAVIAEHDFDGGDDGNEGDWEGYSIAAMYSNNGLFAAVAYEDVEDLTNTLTDEKWRVGVGYDLNAFHIGFVYENQDNTGGGEADLWQVSGSYKFGNNVVKAMYGENDPDGGSTDDAWAVGLDHNFSKRTTAYILYTDSDVALKDYTARGSAEGFALGMIHKF